MDLMTQLITHGDIAADMIGLFEWNVTSYATEWYVPVEDIMEIYQIR